MGKRRILVSFSMGRTSGYLAKYMHDKYANDRDVELAFVTANTSRENPESLAFGAAVSREFNIGITLVEAQINPGHRKATTHRVVSWDRADTEGGVFEAMIAKYGIPNKSYPHCNRELKLRPIHDYVQSGLGWERGSYETAIGIRADEIDRMSAHAEADRIIYPLVKAGVTKSDVVRFFKRQTFDLELAGEHRGNCKDCFKKSLRKLLTVAKETPGDLAFTARMEAEHPFTGANRDLQPRRFYRQNWTTLDLLARAKLPFTPWRDGAVFDDPSLDLSNGCEESCDITEARGEGQHDLFREVA